MKLKKKQVIKPLVFAVTVCAFAFLITSFSTTGKNILTAKHVSTGQPAQDSLQVEEVSLYDELALDSLGLSREAFDYAMQGYNKLNEEGKIKNDQVLSIIDFSLPSTKKRLFVIDLQNKMLLFNTLVSHGRNSGTVSANNFSNRPNSFMSSLGFFVTGDSYRGEHGLSLRLQGEEAGINDNAMARGIVMHSANYVNESLIKSQGYIGRSLGCPAIPESVHRKVIERIRNGSCLFLYSRDKTYSMHTKMISRDSSAT
ncbi:L,D-transpeptidase-like protein [Chitinophaga dinghuensis]|uniref:L,D-transpeptidase-like protein n=1 Tax=Chitinophaga dinghuensis TaxID=1539050 RepID=A0A327WEV9_9BACT|nr:murein L,D-transpeptidase catalytic domain family protein [Chitinophaga dinghuensis]RAJ87890.1 L,D-transpeptidase-like protein [Chitinophaga dinghuensis]